MKKFCLLALAYTVLGVGLSNCTHYATVANRKPQFITSAAVSNEVRGNQKKLSSYLKKSKKEPLVALAGYLDMAQGLAERITHSPNDEALRDEYNFIVARIIATVQQGKLDPWSQPLMVTAGEKTFTLTRRPDARKEWNPALYNLVPADQFDIGGAFIKERKIKKGLGAPLVAIGREENKDVRENFSLPRTYYGVTALVRFTGNKCEISFDDPLAVETIKFNGRTFPLAADFTVPVAVMLASTDPEKMGLARLINPEKYSETARIARLQPYDPNKTVVLVVHGLNSSPATWTPMINTLRSSEEIRRNYQFWFYSYPSGWPYPHSAAVLRKELDAVEKRFPMKKKMVVIGHSMGGCISRLLITDVGDKMWLEFFGKPPEQTHLSARSKELFKDALIFNSRPEIGRVIFIAAPLKGSNMATGWIGRLGSRLVRAPFQLAEAGVEVLAALTLQSDTMNLKRMPNSVDTLAPNNRFVKAINTYPFKEGVPYNTIIGDRGKGGNKDKTPPISSDGIVPYWSSHMEQAESELIVPSGHSAHFNPKAMEEVKRLLLLHLHTPR